MNKLTRLTCLLTTSYLLVGCAVTEWIVNHADSLETGGDVAEGAGPYGVIASLALTNIISAAKWYENKATTKDVISVFQKSKSELDPKAKKVLTDALHKHMPSKVKKIVSKIKKKL